MPLIVTPATSPPAPGAGWAVVLDPTAVTTGRAELNLNSGPIRVDQKGLDWGDAAITAFMADMRIGSETVDYRIPNRHVTIPLFLGADESGQEEEVRSYLQQKVALFQREGGLLMRQRSLGAPMYADIVNATLTLPDTWGETGDVEPNVVLSLECLPDFFGDEISLDQLVATGVLNRVATLQSSQAAVMGDHPGRCRIVVTDTSGNNQLGMLWGLRCRYYDPAPTAALVYEAETLTPLNGSVVTGLAGASGGQVVKQTNLQVGSWISILSTTLTSGSALTHRGSYRVWARCYSDAAVAPQFRFLWGVGTLSVPVANNAKVLPGTGAYYLLDLGEIRLDATPTGLYEWFGAVQVQAASSGDTASVDVLYFQPLDDGAGRLVATSITSTPPALVTTTAGATAGADDASVGTLAWGNLSSIASGGKVTAIATTNAQYTHYFKATGFGFAVPAGATISGILATITRARGTPDTVTDNQVKLIKAGTIVGDSLGMRGTIWPNSATAQNYGSQTSLWNSTWLPSDVNDPNFGVALQAYLKDGPFAPNAGSLAELFSISVTVYYTLGLTNWIVSQDAVLYANGTAELRYDGMFRTGAGATVFGPVSIQVGDLVRLPPSGMEGRPVELFIKPTRGDLATAADPGLDSFEAQTIYRPCYIFRP